jgi:hypothetical protein
LIVSEETPNQLREQLDALTKDLGKVKKANDDLAKENRSLKARQAFADATLSPDLADLFVAANPDGDINAESAKEFAEKYGIGVAVASDDGGTDETTTTQPPVEGLANMNRAGSGSGDGGQQNVGDKTMTVPEYVDLLKRDKVAASEALAKGQVRVRDDNPMARDRVNSGDVNPFDRFNREALGRTQS